MAGGKNQLRVDGEALKGITTGPLPGSRKVYLGELRVPMREIRQTPTLHGHGPDAKRTENPPIYVYDPSGPYTDVEAKIDLRRGLQPVRTSWIAARGDT